MDEERWKEVDGQLSRILHEMAGSVSMCWTPKPSFEVFDSTIACVCVSGEGDLPPPADRFIRTPRSLGNARD